MNTYKSWTGVRDYIRKKLINVGYTNVPVYMFSYKNDEIIYSRLMARDKNEGVNLLELVKEIIPDAYIYSQDEKDRYGYYYRIHIPNISKYLEKNEKMEQLKTPNVGDTFLCKRYFNAKRIIYVPAKLLEIGESHSTLLDMNDNVKFTVSNIEFTRIKPISEEWVMNKVKNLQAEKAMIEFQIKNLFSIWTKI